MRTVTVLRSIVLVPSPRFRPSCNASFNSPPIRVEDDQRPLAPGAAAVFLYREEETDDRNHFYSFYSRIKVLTEKARNWRQFMFPTSMASIR